MVCAMDIALCGKETYMDQNSFCIIESGTSNENFETTLEFPTAFQPRFQKNFELLFDHIQSSEANGYETLILSNSAKQLERLNAIFEDSERKVGFIAVSGILHEGFSDHEQ